jgi:hypothetical protein
MRDDPTFFLTSTEARPTLVPRKCWIVERLWSDERKDYFLRIRIQPPIAGRPIGLDQEVVDEVVIATRHKGTSLSPISELPIYVYVCYMINSQIQNTGQVSSKDLQIILIGEIYETMADADKAIRHENKRF